MSTFLQKHRDNQGGNVAGKYSRRDGGNDVDFDGGKSQPATITRPDVQGNLSPGRQSVAQFRQSLNQRPETLSLTQTQQRLNQSPRVTAQAKLASTLSSRNSAVGKAHQAKTTFATQTTASTPVQRTAQDIYDAAGQEKWREFIDLKDQEAAEKEYREGLLTHPGEYYNYQREGQRVKVGDHWKAFQKADAYVSESIQKGTPLSAAEYLKIHMLAAGGYESEMKKGWRTGSVTWGLKDPSEAKMERLRGKGLQVAAPEMNRATVTVPEPDRGMAHKVQALFDEYNQLKGTYPGAAAVELYEKLELLHPTKDASSRTNHLILNRLLAEYGLSPAILAEPNTPEQSYEQVTDTIIGASRFGNQVALSQGPESVEALRKGRRDMAIEEDIQQKAAAMLRGEWTGTGIGRGASSSAPRGGSSSSSRSAQEQNFMLRLLGKGAKK